ncbi:NUDIX domain-containing protein [Corynebacterium otitidis]|uniref:Nudix hydrolase domain-containing protein n=1 Tax=Corynebacterium otitidis ATCC 51513 TaxID=883169 RepID=I7LC40_9CORY|nr:NUDIX hydrolase [Corynebacterium otitidis]EJZ82365.1 hypothetical protein HMPREF9719_00590 [Corynebacterium otitidis ATCC 51513]CCI83624.1 hypothetical protein BN46_0894 [Corynebacterium otitidis ATCC 51513]
MSHTFEVTSSRILLEAPIIAVRSDEVTMPGGGSATREVVEHFGATAIAAVDDDGRVAMVRQYRHTVGRRLWELPAGLLDVAGEDPLDCARRELVEEAGLKAESWGLLLDLVPSPGYGAETIRVFLARGLRPTERPEAAEEEADMELEFWDLDEAVNAALDGRVVNSIAVAGLFAAREVLSGRREPRSTDEPFDLRPEALARRRRAAGVEPDMKRIDHP